MDNQRNISVTGDNRGLIAGRDIKDANLINTGDVTGSYNAIGVGAQVIINQIQEARSVIAELSAEIRLAETQLADAVAAKIQKLLQAVEGSANRQRSNPYRSLLDYRLEDAPYFYGRETAIRELLDKIHDHRLTILHADSGAGKSSLLKAGIGARLLAAGHLPLCLRPYREPVSPYIKRAFLTNLDALPELERFQEMPLEGFLDAVTDYLGDSTLYLFLDQFEEFFVEQPQVAQEQFIDDLADCLDETGLDVRWVLSMRKEYFSDLRRFQPRIEPFVNEYFLSTFQLTEAKEVIVEPARKQGVDYESPALVDQILADLQDEDGTLQPPQVQLVCYNLFEEVRTSATPKQITTTLYQQPRGRGETGAKGILSSHLSRVLKQMASKERATARHILEALVTSQTRRERVAHDALLAELQRRNRATDATHLNKVLAQLVDSRLLRTDEDDDDNAQYELAHDYLLGEIELDPETLARKAAQELLNQEVVAWQVDERSRISEEKLRIIEEQQANLLLTADATELLKLSREAIGRRRRTVFVSYGAAAVAAVVAIVAGIVAFIFLGQADTAQQDADAAIATVTSVALERATAETQSVATLDAANQQRQAIEVTVTAASAQVEQLNAEGEMLRLTNLIRSEAQARSYDSALLIAQETILRTLQSNTRYTTNLDTAAREVIRTAPPFYRTISGHNESVESVAFNHDDSLVVTAGWDGTAKLWDVAMGSAIHTFSGHGGPIRSAAFNHDSSLVVTVSDDNTAKLWDVVTGTEVRTLSGHSDIVRSAAFSHDGSLAVTASWDATTKLWDVATGSNIYTLGDPSDPAVSAAFNHDSSLILTSGDKGTAKLWDVLTGTEFHTLSGHSGIIRSATFSYDGTMIVTTDDGKARVWNVATGSEIHTLNSHSGIVWSAIFNHDGSQIVTAGDDGTAKLWDVKTGSEIYTLSGHTNTVNSAVFNRDGSMVVTASDDGTARVWNVASGSEIHLLTRHDSSINSAVFNHNGSLVVTAGSAGTVKLWDVASGSDHRTFSGHRRTVESAAFNKDGSLAVTTSRDSTAKLWDVRTATELHTFVSHNGIVWSAAFNHDSSLIVTAGSEGDAKLWDVATGCEIHTLSGHNNSVNTVEFNHDGSLVLTASQDTTAKLWDVATGRELHTFNGWISSASFNKNGSLVVTASSDGIAKVWDVKTGREIQTFTGHNNNVRTAVFNHDDTLIVTTSDDGTAKLWDVTTGNNLHTLTGHSSIVLSADFNNNSSLIVTASSDGTAKLWDVITGSERHTLSGHNGIVKSAVFNHDGSLVVSASLDGTARLWDVETGNEFQTLSAHSNYVRSAVFSNDGSLVLTASWDGTAKLWLINVETLLTLIHSRIQRDPPEFTDEEKIRYDISDPIPWPGSDEE